MKTLVIRRKLWRTLCFRKTSLFASFLTWTLLVCVSWKVSSVITRVLLPPPPLDQDLSHFRRSRSLKHYLDKIELLVDPSHLPCDDVEELPVIIMVASAPGRVDYRDAIRNTWGKHLPTYFIMGLDYTNDNQLIDNYVEAKQFSDMIVYDFKEHYQNLTLKTSLMMQWTLARCPNAQFLYKTDDDNMINPWIFKEVLEERGNKAQVLGYVHNNSVLHRETYNKWYLPRWLCQEDVIPQYITGPGYLINGAHISHILEAAKTVPLHNIEDVYFTYNVAKKTLGYNLSHDVRMYPYRPWPSWIPIGCAYWVYASVHSLTPPEILRVWSYLESISKQYIKGQKVCQFYKKYVKRFIKTSPW